MSSAQYDNPPYDLVGTICRAIDGVPQETYILDTIAKGLNASFGGDSCIYVFDLKPSNQSGWEWQVLIIQCFYIYIVDNYITM